MNMVSSPIKKVVEFKNNIFLRGSFGIITLERLCQRHYTDVYSEALRQFSLNRTFPYGRIQSNN